MAEAYVVEPDLDFIKEVGVLGGEDLKKCYQCATCSIACPISPDTKPFPRKEMIAASWGLKDKLLGSADIWLCHNCGDCNTLCPRTAKPGEVLAALRQYAIKAYATPKKLAEMVNDPKKLPILVALPALIILGLGYFFKLLGIDWLNIPPGGDEIVHAHFIHTTLVDIIMIPTFFFGVAVFALGLKRFLNDIHQNALLEGKTDKQKIEPVGFAQAFVRVLPTILKHRKFSECTENQERSTAHLMVFFGFIGLFIVTNIFFVVLYGFGIHGPYQQINPVKWLANVSGIALIIGSLLMIKSRLDKKDQKSYYKDWFLLGLALGLGLTGMLTQMTRLAGFAGVSYTLYFIHLIFIWGLFAYTPFTKLAHLVYRTVAMTYAEYANRK